MPPLLDLAIVTLVLLAAVWVLIRHLTQHPGVSICTLRGGGCPGCGDKVKVKAAPRRLSLPVVPPSGRRR